jgi:hypothetical protein
VLESEEVQKCPGLRFILKISAQGTCNRHPVSLVRRESPKAHMLGISATFGTCQRAS